MMEDDVWWLFENKSESLIYLSWHFLILYIYSLVGASVLSLVTVFFGLMKISSHIAWIY